LETLMFNPFKPLLNYARGRWYPNDPDLRDFPLMLLGYLGFLFLPFFTNLPPKHLWPSVIAVAVFLPFYFEGFWVEGRRLYRPIIGMAAVGFALAPFNWGAQTFIIFACAAAGTLGQLRDVVRSVSLITLLYTALALYLRLHPLATLMPFFMSWIVALANANMMANKRRNAILRLSQEEVGRLAKQNEQERIARDLHDVIGHSLSLIAVKSNLANKLLDRDPAAAKKEMEDIENTAREALREVRATLRGLRFLDLSAELARAQLGLKAAGLKVEKTAQNVGELSAELDSALAFALRESVTNIIRHAGATLVQIEALVDERKARLSVRDDGCGGADRFGNGLSGLRERIDALGGQLNLESPRGAGTLLEISFDVKPQVIVAHSNLRTA
jgi:two-component system, NarL family, sensor histidine kinase DesK